MLRPVFALILLVALAAFAIAQGPPQPPPSQPPPAQPPAGEIKPGVPQPVGQSRGSFAPPPFPGDTMAAERDSLMNVVMKRIAGKEQMPAESVFKDIQVLKGRRAGDIPRVMSFGFGRSLGASCFHCHARDDWAKDNKHKTIAREMFKMVTAINTDYIQKIQGLDSVVVAGRPPQPPVVNCGTCHRGSVHANAEIPRPGGMRPGGGQAR
ncbi:MAG TPA: photosynthetic reaction center cytochrome c subunit family protein [Candidatus Eisenbacteria bacterium]|nr:photosynthetic reaction center cytochrome c subunit family protein [Candidatus Eisenbacteria bacterium]